MIRLNEETRKALLQLTLETQVYPEGNILKLIDADGDPEFQAYLERAIARDRNMRQRRLEITKQVQIQNRDLTKFNDQITILNQDLTIALEEQKKAKEQVIAALKILERKNRDLAQFSWMTSHNLRGPLASTLGIINLLRDYMQASADLKGLYDHLRGSAIKMDEVLADVSMLLETRETPAIQNEKLVLEDLLDECIEKLQVNTVGLRAAVNRNFVSCPAIISTKNYVDSILQQLLLNAVQYCSEDRKPAIEVSAAVEEDFAVIRVTDNGTGIKSDDLDKIFEPFKKLHYASTGKGLGLYVARTQAEALGGSLTVTSDFGFGSVFILRLPINGFQASV